MHGKITGETPLKKALPPHRLSSQLSNSLFNYLEREPTVTDLQNLGFNGALRIRMVGRKSLYWAEKHLGAQGIKIPHESPEQLWPNPPITKPYVGSPEWCAEVDKALSQQDPTQEEIIASKHAVNLGHLTILASAVRVYLFKTKYIPQHLKQLSPSDLLFVIQEALRDD